MSKNSETQAIIENSVLWSMGAAVIPVPIGDFIAVTAVQLDMLKRLSKAMGKDYQEISARSFILALNSGVSAKIGASLIKSIPGVGSFIGAVSLPVMSAASTYSLGNLFVSLVGQYGSIEDIDMTNAKEQFNEFYEKGKQKVEEWKKKGKDKGNNEE